MMGEGLRVASWRGCHASIKESSQVRVIISEYHIARMGETRNAYRVLSGNMKEGIHL
jgi:hypothetical protein